MASLPYLKTVDHALQIILKFDEEHREWSSSELSQAVGLHRSIVYRLLITLQRRGFVTPTERRGCFRLGTKLIELGNVVLADIGLRDVARPIMNRLVEETGESVALTVVDENQALGIEWIPSPHSIHFRFSIGHHYPLYAGATNKVLLAYLAPEKIDAVIAQGLPMLTEKTVTDPAQLKQDLALIRQQGWAYSVGEMVTEMAAVAAPIWDRNRTLVASIGIGGFASHFGEERLPLLIDATRKAAYAISDQLLTWRRS